MDNLKNCQIYKDDNTKNNLYVVMYHYVRDLKYSLYPKITGLDVNLFKQQLDFFEKHFNIVTMEDVLAAKYENHELPDNALLLTFDDGYIDNFDVVFPILKNRSLQGSFFIPGKTFAENVLLDVNKIHFLIASAEANNIMNDILNLLNQFRGQYPEFLSNDELIDTYYVANRFDSAEVVFCKRILQSAIPEELRNRISSILFERYVGVAEDVFARQLYMTRDQILCMKNSNMFIGIHGYDHYWLGNLTEEAMRADIDKALVIMDEFIDSNNWLMNYPYGNYSDKVVEYVKEKGCKLGFTTEVRLANLNSDNPLLLPRFDCNDFPPKSNNYTTFLKEHQN